MDLEATLKFIIFVILNAEITDYMNPEFIKAFKFALVFNLYFGINNIKKDEHVFELFSSYTQKSYLLVLDKNLLINLTEAFQIEFRQG